VIEDGLRSGSDSGLATHLLRRTGESGRNVPFLAESRRVDLAAALVGLLAGVVVGPLADRLATNAPVGAPLLARAPFSPRLRLVSAATMLLGGACGLAFGFSLEALVSAVFCWILVIVTRTDLEHRLIPDRIVLPGALLMVVGRTVDEPSAGWILAGLGAGVGLFLLVLAYPRGMGMGDVKLALFLGCGLGLAVVVALFAGFVAAAVPAVVLLARHGQAARKQAIPLGPFLALGALLALFAGEAILDWYWDVGT
jgi:prepilin signal peptidase PulO-like enzyme (type II secretory pathway)